MDPACVQAMLERMVHRGPDSNGIFREPGISAGIRRLAVIDIEGGDQPIASEDGNVQVVCNGEIYNFRELRKTLEEKGHLFRTFSDTEVLVHLWEEHGPGMVDHLNGMFSFCIHDSRKKETFIARDRLGIKPLYYALEGETLAFASELAALLRHPDVSSEIDFDLLQELFCLQYISGSHTVYSGVRKLLPGHAVHVRNGAASIEQYYRLPRPGTAEEVDDRQLGDELRALVEDAVRLRTVADVPLGMFLSGGIDSTIVLRVLSDISSHPVKTYSVGFDSDEAFDERRYARLAAERFGADHREMVLSASDMALQLPWLVEHLAEPVMDPAMIPTFLLSRFAGEDVTVVLTGEGADELFAGYRRYLHQHRYGWLSRVPLLPAVAGSGLGTLLPGRTGQGLEAACEPDPVRNHIRWTGTVSPRQARSLFTPGGYLRCENRIRGNFARYFGEGDTVLSGQLRSDMHEWLPHDLLFKVDAASMAHSLEARVPFLDHRVAEWAVRLPDDRKIRSGDTKWIVRHAFRGDIPDEIVRRPKRGFDLPLDEWIRTVLRPLAEEMLAPGKLRRWEGLNVDAAGEMLASHLSGKKDRGLPLFCMLSVMMFLETRG